MKVLFVIPYFFNSSIKQFKKNKTGFGIILDQMIECFGNHCELSIFTNTITTGGRHYNATILKHTWLDVLFSISNKDILSGIRSALKSNQRIRDRLLYIYYRMNCGALRKAILQVQPDVIHCHGVSEKFLYYIETSIASGVPVVVTLHGLIGLTDSIKAYYEDKKAELIYLKYAENNKILTTVISSGMLKRIQKEYQLYDTDFIKVISNGIKAKTQDNNVNIREKYGISKENRIILSVGNLSENKNQMQIVRSFALLPKELQKKLTVLLLGAISSDYDIKNEIVRYGLVGKVICCGYIDNSMLSCYYNEADLNILASFDEGFGLPIIEGFIFGVPCVTFSNIDAIPDIYNEKAMRLCSERTDEAFASTIMTALNNQWEKEWICEYGKRFSLEKMTEKYIDLYQKAVSKHEQ